LRNYSSRSELRTNRAAIYPVKRPACPQRERAAGPPVARTARVAESSQPPEILDLTFTNENNLL